MILIKGRDEKDSYRPRILKRFLTRWFWRATHSRFKPMRDFAWTLRNYREDLLNYFNLRIDNGAVEGISNKGKVVSQFFGWGEDWGVTG
jgi:transposase